jgi:S1-C subfamily serine protease
LASIVRVETADGVSASGVVIGTNRVVTAAHAVDNAEFAFVRIERSVRQATILAMDEQADLALLAVDTGGLTPVRLSERHLDEEEPVWAVGFPRAREQQTTAGRFRRQQDGRLHTSAFIDSGDSGGGLLRCSGGAYELAGVVHGFVAYRQGHEYINTGDSASVPTEHVLTLMSLDR